MKQTTDSDQKIIKYLLKMLSAEDQARFEEAYLGDGSLFEQVQALEEELIEDYVNGNLSGRECQNFERHYLVSEQRRARIETARQLVRVCSFESPAQAAADDAIDSKYFSMRSGLRLLAKQPLELGLGVASALLLLLGSALVIGLLRLQGRFAAVSEEHKALESRAKESERLLAEARDEVTEERKQSIDLRARLEKVNAQLNRLEQGRSETQASNNQVVSLALAPGIRDINKLDRAVISAHTSFVELRANLERQEGASQRPYRVIVKTVEGGREIWTQEGIRAQSSGSAKSVVVRVPAERFKAAGVRDFTLTLSGLDTGGKEYEEIESCYFQVTSK